MIELSARRNGLQRPSRQPTDGAHSQPFSSASFSRLRAVARVELLDDRGQVVAHRARRQVERRRRSRRWSRRSRRPRARRARAAVSGLDPVGERGGGQARVDDPLARQHPRGSPRRARAAGASLTRNAGRARTPSRGAGSRGGRTWSGSRSGCPAAAPSQLGRRAQAVDARHLDVEQRDVGRRRLRPRPAPRRRGRPAPPPRCRARGRAGSPARPRTMPWSSASRTRITAPAPGRRTASR